MPSDGSIVIDTRIDTKSARADLQMLEAKAKSTTQEIGALDKSLEKAGKQKLKAGEDLDNARAAADATAKALEEVNARLEKAQAEARAAVRQEYPSMSEANVNDIALSRAQGANPELFSQSDQLVQKLDQQESKAADLEAEYQKQVAAVEKLDALHAQLVERLKQEQAAAQAQAEAVQKAEAAQQRARQMQAGDDAMQKYFAKQEAAVEKQNTRDQQRQAKIIGSDDGTNYVARAEEAVKATQKAAEAAQKAAESSEKATSSRGGGKQGRCCDCGSGSGSRSGKDAGAAVSGKSDQPAEKIRKASGAMQQFGSRLSSIVSGALLFNIISSGLSKLVGWMGSALQSTDAFRQALANLQGAASVAAAPLVDALGGALAYVINLLATGMSYLARFISMLTGKSLSAMKSGAKAMNSYGSAAGSAAKQTEKATHSLAGFDEITRLDAPQQDSSGGGGGTSGPNYDFVDQTGVGFSNLLNTVKAFWDQFTAALAPSIAAWEAAWAQIKSTALTVWPQIQEAASGLWQNALAPLLGYLAGTWAPGILNAFSQAFAPIVGDVLSAYIQIAANWFAWLCGLITDYINNLLRPALETALSIWQGMMEGIQAAWAEYGQPLMDGVILAFQNIETVLSALYYNVVEPIMAALIDQIGALWDSHLQPLWNDLLAMFGALGETLLTFWNNILAPLITWLMETFGPTFADVFNAVQGAVATAVGLISDGIDVALIAFEGILNFLTAVFRGDWDAAWSAIGDTVTRVWDRIQAAVKSAVNGVIGFVNGMIQAIAAGINRVADALNSLSFSVPDWVPGLGGSHIGFSIGHVTAPQIPYLAQGAVIPPNREFMAVLGDQSHGTNVEAPLATIQQAVATVMRDYSDGELAALEQVTEVLREILSAIYGINIGDDVIGRAVRRYNDRRAIMTGGVI